MKYFNRYDREHHLCMLVTWDYLGTWVEETKCLSPIERKWLRTVVTYLKKISDNIVGRSDSDYITSLTNQARNSSVNIEDNRKKIYKEEFVDVKTVVKDDLYELFDYALIPCQTCCNKDFKSCERYQLFMKMGVPPLSEETNSCPYR